MKSEFVFVLILRIFIGINGEQCSTEFRKKSTCVTTYGVSMGDVWRRSPIDCARSCAEVPQCQSYFYFNGTQMCRQNSEKLTTFSLTCPDPQIYAEKLNSSVYSSGMYQNSTTPSTTLTGHTTITTPGTAFFTSSTTTTTTTTTTPALTTSSTTSATAAGTTGTAAASTTTSTTTSATGTTGTAAAYTTTSSTTSATAAGTGTSAASTTTRTTSSTSQGSGLPNDWQYMFYPYFFMSYPCQTDPDCDQLMNSECRDSICQCLSGYSFSWTSQSCVSACTLYGHSYQIEYNTVIVGFDSAEFPDMTEVQCLQKCTDTTVATCRSAEYDTSTSTCYLSNETALTQSVKQHSSKNLYQRDCLFL